MTEDFTATALFFPIPNPNRHPAPSLPTRYPAPSRHPSPTPPSTRASSPAALPGPLAPSLSDAAVNRSVLACGVCFCNLACLPISSGWFRREHEDRRRLIKVQCYSGESTANFYMRPIEGLTVLVDLDTKEIVHIADEGCGIPIPKSSGTDHRFAVAGGKELKRSLFRH